MRYQRLLLEYGSLSFTLPLHQRLTVISGVGPQEREGLVGELLGALTGTRRGIRLEVADDRGRELLIERGGRAEDDRLVDLLTGLDLTGELQSSHGDALAYFGVSDAEARRRCGMTSADVRAAGEGDAIVARLARLPQRPLWEAAERVKAADAGLR